MKTQGLILVVEDNPDDVLLIRRAFVRAGVTNPCRILNTGEEAIDYLNGAGRFSDRDRYPRPALVLLDLRLPGKDGFEVLRWIRAKDQYKDIRIVVATASDEIREANRAYQLGANSFLVKPLEFENSDALISMLKAQKVLQPAFAIG
jgi:CheY-like chemotaxis protein